MPPVIEAANDNGPLPIPALTPEQQARFWSSVDKSAGPDECWPWTGTVGPYGRVKIDGVLYLTHRVATAIETESDLSDVPVLRHTCDNPPCCNPGHHVTGDYTDNAADMLLRGRGNPRRGESHPMAAANDNLVAAIKASPLSGRKAATHFGVSYGMVANIRSGRRWAHVEAA